MNMNIDKQDIDISKFKQAFGDVKGQKFIDAITYYINTKSYRVCNRCLIRKKLTDYYNTNKNECKKCRSKRAKKYYQEHKEEILSKKVKTDES